MFLTPSMALQQSFHRLLLLSVLLLIVNRSSASRWRKSVKREDVLIAEHSGSEDARMQTSVLDTDSLPSAGQSRVLQMNQLDLNKKIDWDAFRLQALDTKAFQFGVSSKSKQAGVPNGLFGIESVASTETATAPSTSNVTNTTAAGVTNGTLTIAEIPVAMNLLSSKDVMSQFF